jgi:hypothetical protein
MVTSASANSVSSRRVSWAHRRLPADHARYAAESNQTNHGADQLHSCLPDQDRLHRGRTTQLTGYPRRIRATGEIPGNTP